MTVWIFIPMLNAVSFTSSWWRISWQCLHPLPGSWPLDYLSVCPVIPEDCIAFLFFLLHDDIISFGESSLSQKLASYNLRQRCCNFNSEACYFNACSLLYNLIPLPHLPLECASLVQQYGNARPDFNSLVGGFLILISEQQSVETKRAELEDHWTK